MVMPRFIAPIASLFFAAVLLTLVSGCERPVDSCAEFDPPPGKVPSAGACPTRPAAVQAQPARYCYSSLAQVDCFAEPQPGRPGYMGSTEAPPPVETTAKAKGEKGKAASEQTTTTTTTTAPAAVQPSSSAAPAPAASAPTPLKPASAN